VCTVYSVHCTVYSIQYTVCSRVQCVCAVCAAGAQVLPPARVLRRQIAISHVKMLRKSSSARKPFKPIIRLTIRIISNCENDEQL
jgi:hypothetical protein